IDSISHPITQVQDLSDGIILFEVVSDIDQKWFKLIRSADVGDNWVLKINNLKKLYKLISRYYEENLDWTFSRLPEVNLTAIAKDSNPREILQLCKYILIIAVFSANASEYINRITKLNKISQQHLMNFIDDTMRYKDANGALTTASNPSMYAVDDLYPHNNSAYRTELVRITKEKEQLEVHNKQLIDDHSELLAKYDRLEAERQDLQARLRDMDNAVARANETGKADFIMRTEIDHLKQDLQRSEDTRQEQERRLEDQATQIKDLTRKTEELAKHADLAAKYKDQQVKHLEETNHNLMEHNSKLEEEYRSILAFKTLMDSYKNQVAELETKNNELIREKNRLDYQLAQYTKKVESLEADKARDTDRIQALEEDLQEAQLRMVGVDTSVSQRETNEDADDMDIDNLNDSLEDNLKESNVAELKMTKRRLERQVKTLQEAANAGGNSQKVLVLQHLLDDANRLKTKFEKEYIEVSKERDILQSDMARIREGIPDALLDQSESTLSLRLRIVDLEKEVKSLTESMTRLEKKIADGRYFAENDKDNDGINDIRSKYDEMETKSRLLEEQARKQLHDINKLLLEKDLLQGQSIEQKDLLLEKERLNSEMKATLAAIEAKEDEPFFKQQYAQLQQQLIKVKEDMTALQGKLRKAQDFIQKQDKLMKENEREKSSSNHYAEAVESLKEEIHLRDEENNKLKKLLHETRSQARREQQLMISAWYDMSRKVNKDMLSNNNNNMVNVNKRQPTSWLGQQRRALDNQIKRR
ncbi:hypothetical protein BDF20DRAFT_819150, partial [Mycotypha africana]|uniref:uncharacterized protein n=1 Tax=Mycotypha africana TaxID=64632 RepID=UPI0023002F7C